MEINIYYYLGRGRNVLTARIMRGQIRLCDKSTKIKVEPIDDFDYETKRFKTNKSANKALTRFESLIDGKCNELNFHYKGNTPDQAIINALTKKSSPLIVEHQELNIAGIATAYRKRAYNKNMFSKKTGRRLADDTFECYIYAANLAIDYIDKGGTDLDLGVFNWTTIQLHGESVVKKKYDDFISAYKNYLIGRGQEDSSIFKNLHRMKAMINYFAELHGIKLGDLLKDLKSKKPKKEVIVLSAAQVEFVIINFNRMQEGCTSILQKWALEYWYTALILNPRRKDMGLWDRDNLYTGFDGATWIKFTPHKTKNTSEITIDAMVPDALLEVFKRNVQQHKKLLPPLIHNLNLHIKAIAQRYDIFHNDLQIKKKGKFITIKTYKYVHIHMMRGSGMTHKLENGWSETEVKEQSGHTFDSESFERYVKISNEKKAQVSRGYFAKLGI